MTEEQQRVIEKVIWHCSDCLNFKPNWHQTFFRDGLRGYCKEANIEVFNASAKIPSLCPLPVKDWSKKS